MFVDLDVPPLNPQQQSAVDHRGSPLLIIAGAGTGKTKTLAARVVALIEGGVDPNRILLLTFTRRAAVEMLSRVSAATTDRAAAQVWGGTFHATANRLLRHYGQAAGLASGFTVLDQADSTDLFGWIRAEEGFAQRGKRFPRAETIAAIYSRMVNSQGKLAEVLHNDYPWTADHGDALKTIFTAYTAAKRRQQVLDYDDLLLFWRGLLAAPIGEAMRNQFDHILIDEFQDTNAIQADIVRGMARDDTEVCAVGDDAQAIYGFRAATVANLWAFPERFANTEVIALEQNYRSTTPILELANAVINGGDTEATERDERFTKHLWTNRPGGLRPRLITCHDEAAQSVVVAESILAARERGIDLRDQAVLFRAGHHSSHLELELTRRDIPFVKYGGLTYLEAAHVKDLMALLRILDNPADRLAWHRVLAAIEGVGPATVRRLSAELGLGDRRDDHPDEAGVGMADGGAAGTSPASPLQRFLAPELTVPAAAGPQVHELRAALTDCLDEQLAPAGQVDRLKRFCALNFAGRYDNAAARLADIDQLAATAAAYGSRSRFLTELTLDPPGRTGELAGPPHLDDDWITLSTIHSAKGLEWRSVHLIHAADGNLPSDMALGDRDGLAEERRLLYVALTRARQELTVTFPLRYHVHRFGGSDRHHLAQLSRFLQPVRSSFDELATGPNGGTILDLHASDPDPVDGVGVADEVDTLLASLWD